MTGRQAHINTTPRKIFHMKMAVKGLILVFLGLMAPGSLFCLTQRGALYANVYWNDTARYLAGLEVDKSSVLWDKSNEPAFRNHVRFMNNLWSMIVKETIEPVIPWREKNIPSGHAGSIAFYPLSGADFINLFVMFPGSARYVMVAMEPAGDAAALKDCRSRRFIDGLGPIERSIYNYGKTNYFQSKVMMQEMNNSLLPGTAPILLVFMARLGLEVIGVDNITIDESGSIVPAPAKAAEGKLPGIGGVRINFVRPGDRQPRELLYLSMKLTPGSIGATAPEGRFLDRLRNVNTLLKSAVYILHEKNYEPIRNFILQRSLLVVQDDSGIPYSSFDRNWWEVRLYGVYRPYLKLKGCRPVLQNDLAESYKSVSAPLPFNFGYGILCGHRQSNLIVARKRNRG